MSFSTIRFSALVPSGAASNGSLPGPRQLLEQSIRIDGSGHHEDVQSDDATDPDVEHIEARLRLDSTADGGRSRPVGNGARMPWNLGNTADGKPAGLRKEDTFPLYRCDDRGSRIL